MVVSSTTTINSTMFTIRALSDVNTKVRRKCIARFCAETQNCICLIKRLLLLHCKRPNRRKVKFKANKVFNNLYAADNSVLCDAKPLILNE